MPLDAPLGSKLDAVANPAVREEVAARLRLIEGMLLDRAGETPVAAPSDDVAAGQPVIVDAEKARLIAASLKNKPRS